VEKRVHTLLQIAWRGEPGRFTRLLNYARELSRSYVKGGMEETDRFAELSRVGSTPVTGRAYAWMSARHRCHPGGNFVRIPDGMLGGNRFFTLKKL
jgi:hypothetical protein